MKEFEDKFSALQADMVSICLEYVEDRADEIYIYASCEETVISSKFFYLINDQYVKAHKLNDVLIYNDKEYDVSAKRQFMVLDILSEDIESIKNTCKEYERDMPTEMKIRYDVKSGELTAEYKYELVYFNDENKTASDIADEWFKELSNSSRV
ncbi:MAG: immunity protein YezG family protein [Bacillota bacterium]|uniref:immunity protein YezG family protein n=1 Tax=Fictibacillus phosphorivorans TaxID=1221500 RepID=UPI00119EA789|nr:immunity protein YezG family protein [Fictibacillus phosphorivorans]